ncbi:hypothetical protein CE665_21500 [Salmonella enterica subsp. enterica serovar Poona]|nr:hypothetical protein [Salmonella enterica subsp. enterica serovar Poona]
MRISKSVLKITSGRRPIWCCSCCAISGQAGSSASIASLIPCTAAAAGSILTVGFRRVSYIRSPRAFIGFCIFTQQKRSYSCPVGRQRSRDWGSHSK